MSIKKRQRNLRSRIRDLGVEPEFSYFNGGHLRITISSGGQSRFFTASASATDSRSDKNLLGDIRRYLRENQKGDP